MLAESLICLALNVYHEARSQSLVEQIAVAQVVVNRVNDDRYPDSICGVVKQGLFGADMEIDLLNDGPLTFFIDTKNKE